MNMITKINKPSFEIYRSDTTKVPTLKKSFLLKQILDKRDVESEEIIGQDGTEWLLVIEPSALASISETGSANCIISFQVHYQGGDLRNFAVARLISKDKTFPLGKDIRSGMDRRKS